MKACFIYTLLIVTFTMVLMAQTNPAQKKRGTMKVRKTNRIKKESGSNTTAEEERLKKEAEQKANEELKKKLPTF